MINKPISYKWENENGGQHSWITICFCVGSSCRRLWIYLEVTAIVLSASETDAEAAIVGFEKDRWLSTDDWHICKWGINILRHLCQNDTHFDSKQLTLKQTILQVFKKEEIKLTLSLATSVPLNGQLWSWYLICHLVVEKDATGYSQQLD